MSTLVTVFRTLLSTATKAERKELRKLLGDDPWPKKEKTGHKRLGRPPGSKAKKGHKRLGRPPGSKNKVKSIGGRKLPLDAPKRRGRPPGSKNKVKTALAFTPASTPPPAPAQVVAPALTIDNQPGAAPPTATV